MLALLHVPKPGTDGVVTKRVIGCANLMDFNGKHRAYMGFWLDTPYRGANSHLFARQVLTYLHAQIGMENIFIVSPWKAAQSLAQRTGLELVTRISDYCNFGGRIMDIEIYRSCKERWRRLLAENLEQMGWESSAAKTLVQGIFGDIPYDKRVAW